MSTASPQSNNKRIYFAAAVSATIQHIEGGSIGAANEKDMWRNDLYQYIKTKGDITNDQLWDDVMAKASEGDTAPEDVYKYSITDGVLKSSHVVAEVSRISHGVGIEIGLAVSNNIPVLCLYRAFEDGNFARPDNLSRMVRGAPGTRVVKYTSVDHAKREIDSFFAS